MTENSALPCKCLECGKRMTVRAAQRAADKGCPSCGGSDIDVS